MLAILRRSAKPWLIAFAIIAAMSCRKKDEAGPCATDPIPTAELLSWPATLAVDSTFAVPRSTIPIHVYANADANGQAESEDVRLRLVSLRLRADGTDSLLFAEERQTTGYHSEFLYHISLDSIPAEIPATLRITTTNTCEGSAELSRHLLILPN